MTRLYQLALLGLWLTTGQVCANTVLTLDQYMVNALNENIGVKIQQQQLKAQQATGSATFKQLLPAFSLTSGRNQILQDTTNSDNETIGYTTSVSMDQPLYKPTLWTSWAKAQLNVTRADHQLNREIQNLVFSVKQTWYDVLKEQVLNKEANKALGRLKQHKKNAQAFYETGQIWRNDLLQAQVRVAKGEQEAFAANNRLQLALTQINLILNRDINQVFIPKGELQLLPFNDDLSGYYQQAIDSRLDLKQTGIDIVLAQKDRELAYAKRKPTLNLRLSSGVTDTDFRYQQGVTQTSASLNLSWNFWQWGQTNQEINAASAKIKVQQLNEQQQKMQILTEVKTVYLTVKEAQFSLKVSEQALEQAQENFRVSEVRYKEQLGSSNDVLDAQDLLTQTKTDRVLAMSRYLSALAQLDFVTGK